MKIYIDFLKNCITKVVNENIYQGDIFSDVFELLFYNYPNNTEWFPTMSQLAPNGRSAGDFAADPLEQGETHEYVEDGVTYLKFDFTFGDAWVRVRGRSDFFIWANKVSPLFRKCMGKINVMINTSTDNYFISDPLFNPAVKEYIDTVTDEFKEEVNDMLENLGDGSPKYFATAAQITASTTDKGLAVATDTGYLYYWNLEVGAPNKYTSSGILYNDLSDYYNKTEADALLDAKADKSTAITHTGSQLQDYSGYNLYPIIDGNSFQDNIALKNNVQALATNTDLNDVVKTGSYYVTSDRTYTNCPVTNGLLLVFYNANITTQIVVNYSNSGEIYTRRAYQTTWNSWSLQPIPDNAVTTNKIANGNVTKEKIASDNALINNLVLQTNSDLNDVKTTGTYYLTTDRTYTNLPKSLSTASGLLVVIKSISNIVTQIFYVYRTGQTYYRTFNGYSWRDWFNISLNNYWCGKKITILGTSVSFGQYDTESYNNFASKELGFELINTSIPGLAIQTDSNGDSLQYGSSSLSIAEYTAQGITIADSPIPYTPNGQHNNYYSTYEHIFETQADLYVYDVVPNNVDFSLTDWNAFDKDNWVYSDNSSFADHRKTFLGALLFLMDRMYATNSNARMVFVISSKFSYDAGKTALETIANYYKIPIINLWGNITTTPKALQYLYATYNTNQHPSTKAQEIMGKMFVHKLMEIA